MQELLIGNLKNKEEKSFKKYKNIPNKSFLSSSKLINQFGFWSDTDKDGYLNFADCFPFDKKRHAVIPASLQAKRPVIPKTLYQQQQARLPQQTQQQAVQTATQVAQQVQDIPQSQFSEMDWYKAAKMALSGKGESDITYGTSKLYSYIMNKERVETSGLSGQEQEIIRDLQYQVQSGYTAKQASMGKLKEYLALPASQRTFGAEKVTSSFDISTITPQTQTVYYGDRVYKNVPMDVAQKSLNNPAVLEGYGYSRQITPPKEQNIIQKAGTFIGGIQYGIATAIGTESQVSASRAGYQPIRDVQLIEGVPEISLTKGTYNVPIERYTPTKDYYDVSSGMYTSQPYGEEQGTLFMRQPTQEEKKRLDKIKQQEEKIKKTISGIQEGVNKITSLGLSSDTEEYYLPQYQRASLVDYGYGKEAPTKIYVEDIEKKFEREQQKLNNEFDYQASLINEDINSKYQELINKGVLSYEEAIIQSEAEFNERIGNLTNDYNQKITTAQDEMQRGIMRKEYPAALVSGIVIGAVSTLVPPIGIGLMALGGANLLFNWEETKETFVKYPKESLITLGLGMGGFFAGGKAVKGIRGYATSLKENPVFEVYKKPEIKRTPFKETFPEEVIFEPSPVSPEGRIRMWEFQAREQARIEVENIAFLKKYPPLTENKPIDFIVKMIPDEAVKPPVKRIRTITDIFPEEAKSFVAKDYVQKGNQVQQLLYKTEQVQEVKQVQLPKSVLKKRVNLISETSPIGLLTSLPLMTESRFSLTQSQKQKQTPKLKQLGMISQSQFSSLLFSQEQKQETKQKQRQISSLSFAQPQVQLEKQKQRYVQPQLSSLLFKQQELQKERQRQLYIQKLRTPQREITRLKEPTRTPFSFRFPGEKEPQVKEQAYEGYAKIGKAWKKVTPLSTKQGAVDRASEFVDRNLSAQFRVLPAKKKIKGKEQFVYVEKQKLKQPTGYWNTNQNKFRRFKQKQGQRTGIPNGAIELQKFRLDSYPGETKKIQEARRQSRVGNFFGI